MTKTAEERAKEIRSQKTSRGSVFDKYGIDLPQPKEPDTRTVTLSELMNSDEPIDKQTYKSITQQDGVYEFQEPKGRTGTRIIGGQISQDPNPDKRPFQVRGVMSSPGEYEEVLLDSNVFRGYSDIRNLMVSSHWSISVHQEGEDDNQDHAEWLNKKFSEVKVGDQQRGWADLIEQISSMIIHGFAIFEVVWATDPETGWKYPSQILFREQSTVWEWLIDLKQDELAGARFKTGDQESVTYMLKSGGPDLDDQEMLLFSINRRGKNYEGISQLRPNCFWFAFKMLLARIAATAADLQGVPVRTVRNALEVLTDENQSGASDDALEAVLDALIDVEHGDDTIIKLPNGVEIDILDKDGTMIDVKPLIEYCDLQISLPFSSEGSLLGQQQVGSYALADVSDQQFLSQIPYYKKQIKGPLDDLIRSITIANIGPQEEYATVDMAIQTSRDSSRFFDDLTSLMKNRVWTWPSSMQQMILEEMGMPLNVFEQWDPEDFLASLSESDSEPAVEQDPEE